MQYAIVCLDENVGVFDWLSGISVVIFLQHVLIAIPHFIYGRYKASISIYHAFTSSSFEDISGKTGIL